MPKTEAGRLARAVSLAHKSLQGYRENRLRVVTQTTGANYSDPDSGTPEPVLLNLLSIYDQTVGRAIISKEPRLMLSTHRDRDKPPVRLMQDWANRELEDMRFADTILRLALDAFNAVGIAKVALSTPADSALAGWNRPAGSAFVERVDLDDWFVDIGAKDFNQVEFEGHFYRVPLAVAKKQFPRYAGKFKATQRRQYNSGGDDTVNTLSPGERSDYEGYEDHVELCEVYCPRQRSIKVFDGSLMSQGGGYDDAPIETRDWVGPPSGPYHHLCFNLVPGNLLPIGPKQHLVDMHVSINGVLNKLVRQAQRQKSVLPYAGADTSDVEKLERSSDGGLFKVNGDPGLLKELRFGGPDAANYQFMEALWRLADWAAGNLSILGGLAPQSRTATQDKMLNENSTRMVADMSGTTLRFITDIAQALCWYWWHDPFQVMRATWAPSGMPGMAVERALTPRERMQTPWSELRVKIDPYSLIHKTPEGRLQFLNGVVNQLTPMTPLLAQAGQVFDPQFYLQKIAEYGDEPDVLGLYRVQEPLQLEGQKDGMGHGTTLPPETTRHYDRRSTGGDTANNQLSEIGNAMAAEAASGGGE